MAVVAAPRREVDAPARELVECRPLGGHVDGMMDRQHDDGRRQANMLRHGCDVRQHDERMPAIDTIVWLDHFKWFLAIKKGLGGYSIGPLFYWDSFLRDLKPDA